MPVPSELQAYGGAKARRRNIEKTLLILRWLYVFEFSGLDVLAKMLRIKKTAIRNTIADMQKKGLIDEVKSCSFPQRIFHLTYAGLSTAEIHLQQHFKSLPKPRHQGSRLNLNHVAHDMLVQEVVVDFFLKNTNLIFESDQCLRRGSNYKGLGRKIPDAVMLWPVRDDHEIWAVEVQQTRPKVEYLEREIYQYGWKIANREITGVIYASTHGAILNQIKDQLNNPVHEYQVVDYKYHRVAYRDCNDPLLQTGVRSNFMLIDLSHLASRYYTIY